MLLKSAASAVFALALPAILLMYLLRRRYPETEIASHLLWRRALREQEANRPWQRLRRSLLLLLQLIVAACLAFALMGPQIPGQASPAAPVVIVVDRSASMTAAASRGSGEADALDEALQAVAAAVEELPSSRPVTLIAAGAEPELLLGDETDRREIRRALGSIGPRYGRTDEEAALTLADALVRDREGAELWLATDGRIRADIEGAGATGVRLFVAGRNGANTSVAAFGLQAGADAFEAAATLIHYGSRPAEGTLAIVPAGAAEPAAERPFRLEPGEQRVFTFAGLPSAEYYRAEIRAVDDYEADNAAFAFPAAPERGRALLVGEGSLFLAAALGLAGIDIVQADPARFEPGDETFESIDWIVIHGADEKALDTAAWRKLIDSRPVWRIWSASSPPPGGRAAEPEDNRTEIRPHPVTAHITLADTHIARIVQADPGPGMEAIARYGGLPVLYAGSENGLPRLVLAFDPADSDLPLRADFPILAAQAAEWLGGAAGGHLGRAEADASIEIGLRSGTARAEWRTVETAPVRTNGEAAVIEAERTADGAVSSVQTAPGVPGLYRFVEYGGDGRPLGERLLAVHAAQAEGMWTDEPFSGIGLPGEAGETDHAADGTTGAGSADGAGETGAGAVSGAPEGAGFRADALIDLAPYIAVLILLLLAAEWEVYRRGAAC
jgi:hypothetical protein